MENLNKNSFLRHKNTQKIFEKLKFEFPENINCENSVSPTKIYQFHQIKPLTKEQNGKVVLKLYHKWMRYAVMDFVWFYISIFFLSTSLSSEKLKEQQFLFSFFLVMLYRYLSKVTKKIFYGLYFESTLCCDLQK